MVEIPNTPDPQTIVPGAKEVTEEVSLLDGEKKTPEKNADGSLIDNASKEANEATIAEEKRLLAIEDKDLSAEDKPKKEALVKANKEKEDAVKVKAEAEKPPEKYDIKVPEGMTLDQATLDKVSPVFKEIGLSNEKAQKVANAYIEIRKAETTAQETAFNKFVADLKTETITALGANYKEEMSFAAKIKERFFSPGTMDKLNSSGLSNDKDLILDLIKIGRVISEDKLVEGDKGKGAELTAAEKMYGKK